MRLCEAENINCCSTVLYESIHVDKRLTSIIAFYGEPLFKLSKMAEVPSKKVIEDTDLLCFSEKTPRKSHSEKWFKHWTHRARENQCKKGDISQ